MKRQNKWNNCFLAKSKSEKKMKICCITSHVQFFDRSKITQRGSWKNILTSLLRTWTLPTKLSSRLFYNLFVNSVISIFEEFRHRLLTVESRSHFCPRSYSRGWHNFLSVHDVVEFLLNFTQLILMLLSSRFYLQRQYNAVDFKISKDLQYVLLMADLIPVYDYTTLARYYIVELSSSG